MNSSGLTVDDIKRSLRIFGIFDYVVFVAMLLGCSGIGLFYALRGKKNEDAADEYLMGGRNMRIFPISMSLVASFISGITLLGNPTEMYLYGTEYMFVTIGMFFSGFLSSYVFLPVFHDMKLSSTYEYLERRFDKKVRLFGSILFTLALTCWLPIVIYVPALAFNLVTGINIHIITPCVCIVCIFYTTIGGLKAVVWTDVVQTIMMVMAMIVVIVKGSIDIGGFNVVWQRCWDSGRIETPSFQVDLTLRHSLWGLMIGSLIFYIQAGVINQNMIQRYMALPTLYHARCALWIFILGTIFIVLLCCASGLLVYATYYDCDPLTTKLAVAKDQLLPLLVMQVLGGYPGMPGLFVAGIFSAALSSLSTGLNSMSAVVLEDFIKPFLSNKLTNRKTNLIMRGVVIVFGTLCVCLVFIVQKLGTVLQLSISLGSMTSGPAFGIFAGGMLFPWMNAKGAFYGGIIGLSFSAFVILGAQKAIASGALTFPTKATSVEGCDYFYNATVLPAVLKTPEYAFPLFRISYLWYTLMGGLVTVIIALMISYCTGVSDLTKMDPMCISPVIRKYMPRRKSTLLKQEEQELIEILKKNKMPIERNLDGK